LDGNNISVLNEHSFSDLLHVRTIFLQDNPLKHIYNFAFHNCLEISSMDLSSIGLKSISVNAFNGLRSLNKLDLSNNMLENFNVKSLKELKAIEWINVTKILAYKRYFSVFTDTSKFWMEMEYIGSDDWRLCCFASRVKVCDAPKDELSTCEDLLKSRTLRVVVWITSSMSFIGNMYVLTYRIFLSRNALKSKGNNLFLIHLAVADSLMSVYLLNIAITDLRYRNEYVFVAQSWKTGLHCKMLSMISSLSAEMSLSIICLLSILLLIGISGKGRHLLTPVVKHTACFITWVVLCLLCSVSFTGLVDITSGSCVLFNFGMSVFSGWQYKVFLFVCINSFLITITMCSCLKCIHIIYRSIKQVKLMGQVFGKSRSDSAFKNLILLIVSNLVTWIPVEVLLVVSLCGVSISPQVTNWFAIFVLPVTALSNPFIYTIKNVVAEKLGWGPESRKKDYKCR